MSRQRTPDNELSPEQLKKRLYNERYRARMNEKSIEKKRVMVNEKSNLRMIEKKAIYAMTSNGSDGGFSNDEREMTQSSFSNVLAFPVRVKEENFSIEFLNQLRDENKNLRQEIENLKSRRPTFSPIKNFIAAFFAFLSIVPIPALLVWQMKEMLELTGNKGGLWLAGGLEYAVLIAAGAAGLSKTLGQKLMGIFFVLGLTAVMGIYVVSGIEKRDMTGSDSYKRLTEERQMLVTDRAMLQDQLVGMPLDYKTKRAELQARIETKTSDIATIGAKIEGVQKAGGTENPLATMANIGSRILLMLLEAWMVHRFFARKLER